MTSSFHPKRRHLGSSSRPCPFAMESLAEAAEAETETDNESTRLVESSSCHIVHHGTSKYLSNEEIKQPGCAPFFGVKHYINNFYGIAQDEDGTKVWDQNDKETTDFLPTSSRTAGRCCSRWTGQCFAYCMFLGILTAFMGMICLLLGYLLPRHQILVGHIEEQDLKLWVSTHRSRMNYGLYPNYKELEILDKNAIGHNNLLDMMKITGLVAVCIGSLIIVVTLIFPTCRHADFVQDDEDPDPSSSKIRHALNNCFRTFQVRNNSTVFYPGLLSSSEDKIPVSEQLKPIQPTH